MNARLGELDTLRTLAHALESARHGERATLVERAAKLLNCGKQTVYRKLRDLGWSSGRKTRKDRGRLSVSPEVAEKAAHLIHASTRAHGKRNMPIGVSLEILRGSGEGAVNPETEEVTLPTSASTLSRAMRKYGCHPDMLAQGSPHIHLRSLHPNHCWQVDASLCVIFYLPKGRVAIMDEKKFYKNKPSYGEKAKRERVWRYIITDHYSGNFYLHYAHAAGENSGDLVECFLQTIQKRGLDDPMHGVPLFMLMDKGSANTSALFLNLLDRLGVDHTTHAVGASRVKGQVEQAQNLVETQFESRLSFYRINTLEELRSRAEEWRKSYCAYKIHGRHQKPRNEMWLRITEEQLRLPPSMELCRELVTTHPKEVQVKPDLSITHAIPKMGRNAYDLRMIPGLVPRMKVKVVVNPYRAPDVDVIVTDALTGAESVWTVSPVELDEAGFRMDGAIIGQEYKSVKKTATDRHLERIEEAAQKDRRGAKAPENVDVFADVRPAPEYLPRRGRDMGLDASRREVAPYKLVEAAMLLKDRLGERWPKDAYAWLEQRYGDSVPAADLDEIAERFNTPEAAVITPLRAVNQG